MFELSKCSFGCWVWLFTCQFAGWEGGSSEFRFRLFFNPRAPSIKRENVVLPSYFHFDISTACGAGESNTQSINLSSLLFMIPFSQIILEHGTYYNTFKCQAFILIQGIKTPKVYLDVGALSGVMNLNIYLHVCKESVYPKCNHWIYVKFQWTFSSSSSLKTRVHDVFDVIRTYI